MKDSGTRAVDRAATDSALLGMRTSRPEVAYVPEDKEGKIAPGDWMQHM